MQENSRPQIDVDTLIPDSLSEEEIKELAVLYSSNAWKILTQKIIKPRMARVIEEIATSKSENRDDIFRDVIYTRGQLLEHWLILNIVKAAKMRTVETERKKE